MNKIYDIINNYKNFPQVQAIAIGGSNTAKTADSNSDIDVYIFVNEDIDVNKRLQLVEKYSSKHEVGGEYFGAGDEFYIDELKQQLDVMFWNTNWFKSTVENTWQKHYPQNGYTTCFLFTLKNFEIIYDKNAYLKNLQEIISTPYPLELKKNIIKRNLMLLKDKPFASYYEQIEKAIKRSDINSINHRISAFLASYFDIIFALNELLHPGEKRLVDYVKHNCNKIPNSFEADIKCLLMQPNPHTLEILDMMISHLKDLLKKENYDI